MKEYAMRIAEREMTETDTLEVLDLGEYITVATVDDDGHPYCTPLSYVFMDGAIYIHTTNEYGHKLDDWRRDPRVCATVAIEVEPCYEEMFFTSRFACAMVSGTIRKVEDDLTRRKVLVALCMKYMPSEKHEIGGAIEREFDITDVWAIDIERLTGKAGRRKGR